MRPARTLQHELNEVPPDGHRDGTEITADCDPAETDYSINPGTIKGMDDVDEINMSLDPRVCDTDSYLDKEVSLFTSATSCVPSGTLSILLRSQRFEFSFESHKFLSLTDDLPARLP